MKVNIFINNVTQYTIHSKLNSLHCNDYEIEYLYFSTTRINRMYVITINDDCLNMGILFINMAQDFHT